MRYAILVVLVTLLANSLPGAEPESVLAEKRKWTQYHLDRRPIGGFQVEEAGMELSVSRCKGDFQLRMLYDPKHWPAVTYEFVRDDKVFLSIVGHTRSCFLTSKNVLYFIHFQPKVSGSALSAHDLTTGKELWKTVLLDGHVLKPGYTNQVGIGMASLELGDRVRSSVISVTSYESDVGYFAYVEPSTGEVLAKRVFPIANE